MNCTKFLGELGDLLDHTLDAELLRELEHHMALCSHCKVVYITTRHTIEICRDNELYELEPQLRERLEAAIMVQCRKSRGLK